MLTRSISPLWAVLVVAAVAGSVGLRRFGLTIRHVRNARFAFTGITAACAVSAAWTVYSGTLRIAPPSPTATAFDQRSGSAIAATLRASLSWWKQAYADFGYNNLFFPRLWYFPVIALLGLYVWICRPTARAAAAAFATGVVAYGVSVSIAAFDDHTLGNWWQGRYTLPVLVLLPTLLIDARSKSSLDRGRRAGAYVLGVGLAIYMMLAVVLVGATAASRSTWAVAENHSWVAPLPWPSLSIVGGVAIWALLWVGMQETDAVRPRIASPGRASARSMAASPK